MIGDKCPICHKENNCKVNEECWCFNVVVPCELLKEAGSKNECICEKCIKEFISGN